MKKSTLIMGLSLCMLSGGDLYAQGAQEFLNFETPLHHSMTVVDVDGSDYLLVCNTPDNSIEVYTANVSPQFLLRVPVPQRPVTVVARPSLLPEGGRRIYVASWLADAVSWFDLVPSGASLDFSLGKVAQLGDEPTGIAFLPENPSEPATLPGGLHHESLFVTFSGQESFGWFFEETLLPAGVDNEGDSLGDRILMAPFPDPMIVKDPRAISFAPDGSLFVLNFRGGNNPSVYDYDLWGTQNLGQSLLDERASLPSVGLLGTTNFDMSFAPNGDLYVAGMRARNNDPALGTDPVTAVGEPIFQNMAQSETGFVTSHIFRVKNPGLGTMMIDEVDLNDNGSGGPSSLPISQPTSVLVYGNGSDGFTRVFTTGMGSDSVGMIEPVTGATPLVVTRISIADPNDFDDTNLSGTMRGPRSLALKTSGTFGDSTDLLYVYNRVSHSVTVMDPNFDTTNPSSAVLGHFQLQNDPTPRYIRQGRKFLYSARLSGGGTVSCASCHIDGNTDFLAWNLSDGLVVPPAGQGLEDALGPNSGLKGPMVTQPLLGLVNFEVQQNDIQDDYFSNRPYHWRGDRGRFEHFNGAFIHLMAIGNPHDLANGKGITDSAMTSFRDFTFSMHYPPNPNQPWNRIYSGTVYDGQDPGDPTIQDAQINDSTVGVGAQRGLKLFHMQVSISPEFSCVHCHSLPDGSDNILTDAFDFIGSNLPTQNLESAQIKALHRKQTTLDDLIEGDVLPNPFPVTGEFGLRHTGTDSSVFPNGMLDPAKTRSIRAFMNGFETFFVNDGISAPEAEEMANVLSDYVHEFDTGVGPLVGYSASVNSSTYLGFTSIVQALFTSLEEQAGKGNGGFIVHARLGGVMRGFFYDVRDSLTPYHELGYGALSPLGPFSTQQLLDTLDPTMPLGSTDNLLIPQVTPLGSEKRVAYLGGGFPPAPSPTAPSNIVLGPCPTNTANALVPRMTENWEAMFLNALGNPQPALSNDVSISWFLKSLEFEASQSNPSYGVDELRNEPPRRFRVSGEGIEHGAILRIFAPNASDIASTPNATMPTTVPGTQTHLYFDLPIHPVRDDSGALVWETAAELESIHLLGLINGGKENQAVMDALEQPYNTSLFAGLVGGPNPFDPQDWNWHYVQVLNNRTDPSTTGTGGWQRLSVE